MLNAKHNKIMKNCGKVFIAVCRSHRILKIFLIMKLTTILLLAFTFQVFANSVYSQDTDLTLDLGETTVEKVLTEIERISDFYFLFNQNLVDVDREVNIRFFRKNIDEILDEVFQGTNIDYAIMGKQIVLSPSVYLAEIKRNQQPLTITGTVKDQRTGEPLPGVSIQIKGTTRGAVTNLEGEYSIEIEDPSVILVFSYVGYATQEIRIGEKRIINVNMTYEVLGMEEVVVVGYGTAKKATVTGSISTVKAEAVQRSPVMNMSNSLAGQLPGLVVITPTGEPGVDNSTLAIRGMNTLGNNSPLIVVDGIANRDLNRLNPNDIESITVLKDASAAIYGAQSANGVILIETKRGSEKKTEVNFTLNRGWNSPVVIPELADAATFAEGINEYYTNLGGQPVYSENEIEKYRTGSDPWLYPNSNFYDIVYRDFAPQYSAHASATGGSDKIAYYISGGYRYQDAIYKRSNTKFEQFDFRSNIDGSISKNITVGFDIAGTQRIENQPSVDKHRMWREMTRVNPTVPAVYPNGKVHTNALPVVSGEAGYEKTTTYELLTNLNLDVNIPWVRGLSLSGNFSVDKRFDNEKLYRKPWTLWQWDRRTYDENGDPLLSSGKYTYPEANEDPDLRIERIDRSSITLNSLLHYERSFLEKHNVGVMLGMERNQGERTDLMAYRRYFPNEVIDELFAGGREDIDNTGSSFQSARLNYFGRFNYNYRNKYLIEFVARYDGSHIFPAEHRFGFFPSVSLGWNIAEENFWKDNISFIPYFKLRGSYGQTGNDRIDPFQYLANYGFVEVDKLYLGTLFVLGPNTEVQTMDELRIANPFVTWEVASQYNLGFDSKIADISVSMDYFYNHRTDILIQRDASVPATAGFSLPEENIGEVVNRGFEGQVSYYKTFGSFYLNLSLNAGYAKNEIKFWDEEPVIPEYQKSTGRSINAPLLYEAIGVFRDEEHVESYPSWPGARPGDLIFKDVNEDGEINQLDQVRQEETPFPTLTGGANLNIGYKGFYASVFIQGAAGARRMRFIRQGPETNWYVQDLEGRWTEENIDSDKPRIGAEGIYWDSFEENNTYYYEDNDYVRLKNIEIGYNLKSLKLINTGLRIYVSGANLITLTKLKDFDPEEESGLDIGYPQNKVYNIGISVTL